jgi:uncharacterized membrane protein
MNLSILSAAFAALGEITVAYTVISVHHRFMKEHKVDDRVFNIMRREQKVAIIGIILILIGFILHVVNEFV